MQKKEKEKHELVSLLINVSESDVVSLLLYKSHPELTREYEWPISL